jgi:hypothetical protein
LTLHFVPNHFAPFSAKRLADCYSVLIFACFPRFGAVVHVKVEMSPCSSGHLTVTGAGTQSSVSPLHYHSTGQTTGIDPQIKPKYVRVDFSHQMEQVSSQMENLKTYLAKMNQDMCEQNDRDAEIDRVAYFYQVLCTFVCEAILGPLKFPSSFFEQLASTSVEDAEFRKQVQALGATTGVTVEILLEWEREQLLDDEGSGCIRPPITKAEFIEVGKAMIADCQLTESSVHVFEKVFDVVYPNQI